MLDADQTTLATAQALAYIVEHPLAHEQDLRGFVQQALGGAESDWGDATNIILQQVVIDARLAANANATKMLAAEEEAARMAESAARMAVPSVAAPVYESAPQPVKVMSEEDKKEELKRIYNGPGYDEPTDKYNLVAACEYAKANGIPADWLANHIGVSGAVVHNVMYPKPA